MLTELFAAAAEAVLSYALDKIDPADRLRQWLKRDPATLAYQKALARAYAAFMRQYPDLTARKCEMLGRKRCDIWLAIAVTPC